MLKRQGRGWWQGQSASSKEIELAMECKKILGYRKLLDELTNYPYGGPQVTVVENSIISHVVSLLGEIGIYPFIGETVEAYKNEMINKNMKWRCFDFGSDTVSRTRIPEFVLQTAVDVTKMMSNDGIKYKLEIEMLIEKEKVAPDPFLVLVVDGPERYIRFYLEVWNEPGFKQRREV